MKLDFEVEFPPCGNMEEGGRGDDLKLKDGHLYKGVYGAKTVWNIAA